MEKTKQKATLSDITSNATHPFGKLQSAVAEATKFADNYNSVLKHLVSSEYAASRSAIDSLKQYGVVQNSPYLSVLNSLKKSSDQAREFSKQYKTILDQLNQPHIKKSLEAAGEAARRFSKQYQSVLQQISMSHPETVQSATVLAKVISSNPNLVPMPKIASALEAASDEARRFSGASKNILQQIVESKDTALNKLQNETDAGSAQLINSARDIGRLVRSARLALKLTQQQFADLAGVGRRFLSELESGKETAEIEKTLKVCKAAGIRIAASMK